MARVDAVVNVNVSNLRRVSERAQVLFEKHVAREIKRQQQESASEYAAFVLRAEAERIVRQFEHSLAEMKRAKRDEDK